MRHLQKDRLIMRTTKANIKIDTNLDFRPNRVALVTSGVLFLLTMAYTTYLQAQQSTAQTQVYNASVEAKKIQTNQQ